MDKRPSIKRSRSGIRLPLWGLGLLILVGIVILAGTSFLLFNAVQGAASEGEFTDPDFGDITEPQEQAGLVLDIPSADAPIDIQPTIDLEEVEPWSGDDRVTILALGIDRRCDEEGPTHTDTLMLFTMDPLSLSAAVLSLPRDLWVDVPGFGLNKITQAHFLGDAYDYPGGGPGLAVDTVESLLGINIDYYVGVSFDGFVQGVDAIGGIDVVVPEEIDDINYPDNCYGYEPFYIEAGEHHLDGQNALKYARTRATFGGDVDRAGRQQQVVMAVRDQVLQLNMVPQLLVRAPELLRILQDNVYTDLSINEAIQLARIAQNIPKDSIRTVVLDYDYVYNETTPDGQAVLVPVRENIRALRDELFAVPAIPTPIIENLPEMMTNEGARIAIYNGTSVFGLAASTQDYLLGYGFDIVEVGNADSSEYRSTQVIDYGSNPNTTQYLARLMDIPPLNISEGTNPAGDYDILIILGGNWSAPIGE